MAAPASRHLAASSAISSGVMGRYGVCSRVISAPTIAAVITMGVKHASPLLGLWA